MPFVQLVKFRAKPGADLDAVHERWNNEVGRQPGSGWVKSFDYANAKDPSEVYLIVYFENEAMARASESGSKHQELMGEFAEMMDGEPEYVDLQLLKEYSR